MFTNMIKKGGDRVMELKNKLKYVEEISKINIENINNHIYSLYFHDFNSFFANDHINNQIQKYEKQLKNYIEFIEAEKKRLLTLINNHENFPKYRKLSKIEIKTLKIYFIRNLRRRKLSFRSVHNINKLPEIIE